MTKEQKIKEVYQDLYEKYHNLIDDNGWFSNGHETNYVTLGQTEFLGECEYRNNKFRPISLQGIESNNRWIKINDDTDLPNIETWNYDVCILYEDGTYFYDKSVTLKKLRFLYKTNSITHYKETDEIPKPLY